MPDYRELASGDYTFPFADLIPLATGEWALDDDFTATLSWPVRAVRANVGGTLVYRLIDSADDRTITVSAGEIIPGFFKSIKAGTDCEPAIGK